MHVRRRGKWKEEQKKEIGKRLWLELSIKESQPVDLFLRDSLVRPLRKLFHPFRLCLSRASHKTRRKSPKTLRRFDGNSITATRSPSESTSAVTAVLQFRCRYCCWSNEENSKRSLLKKIVSQRHLRYYHGNCN